jgi:hypothetical protein
MDTYLQIADKINKEISDILMGAINGLEKKYRTRGEASGYIRWGLVEKDIHATVYRNLCADE